jgi:MFS family permease
MFDRAKLMLIAQAIMGSSAVAMTVLTATNQITPALLLGLGLLLGTGLALNIPALKALVPDLVPRGLVASAVALQSVAFNGAGAIGPAIGGALVAAYGAEAGFAVNAFSYTAVIVALLVVGPQLKIRDREIPTSMGSAISLGVRFARFTPPFRNLMALAALFAINSAVVQAVLPIHTDHLGGSAASYGILLGAMGAGALTGAFLRNTLFGLIDGSSVPYTITLFGTSGVLLGLAPNIAVAGVAMFFAGFFWLLTLATLNASAQLMAPSWIRGRAMSLYTLSFAGILPIGSIISGVVADQIGTTGSLLTFSSGAMLLGLVAPRFNVPDIDDIETPVFEDDRTSPPHDEEEFLEGGPVIVLNTWTIDETDFAQFTDLMNDVRLVRLSTGAYRWRLFRSISDPHRITEFFAVANWEEHIAQHGRIDNASAELIKRARTYDRANGPRTRHLIAIDVEHPPDFDDLVASHEVMHQKDGSIPQIDQGD